MITEEVLFGAIPFVVAVGTVVVSWLVSRRARSLAHWCASLLVFLSVAWSLLILYRIFVRGAWPSYLPHFVIGLAVLIVMIQAFLLRRNRA